MRGPASDWLPAGRSPALQDHRPWRLAETDQYGYFLALRYLAPGR